MRELAHVGRGSWPWYKVRNGTGEWKCREGSSAARFSSIPYLNLIRQQVDLGARTIEIIHRGKCVAVHQRRYGGCVMGPIRFICSSTDDMRVGPDRFRRGAASPQLQRGSRHAIGLEERGRRHSRADGMLSLGFADRASVPL